MLYQASEQWGGPYGIKVITLSSSNVADLCVLCSRIYDDMHIFPGIQDTLKCALLNQGVCSTYVYAALLCRLDLFVLGLNVCIIRGRFWIHSPMPVNALQHL